MDLLMFCVILITCLNRLSIAKSINTFIPKYCTALKHSHTLNKELLTSSGNESVLIISAFVHNGLQLNADTECYIIIEAPVDTGIVTTVRKLSLQDNDTITFQSGSNPDKVWLQNDEDSKYKEIVSLPQKDQNSNIYLKFRPSATRYEHMGGFEIVFTAFKGKPEGQTCSDDFDCGDFGQGLPGRCIWPELQCDGNNNCGNEADESGCAGVSIWIIILLVAILLLVVVLAIFVWYRMAQK